MDARRSSRSKRVAFSCYDVHGTLDVSHRTNKDAPVSPVASNRIKAFCAEQHVCVTGLVGSSIVGLQSACVIPQVSCNTCPVCDPALWLWVMQNAPVFHCLAARVVHCGLESWANLCCRVTQHNVESIEVKVLGPLVLRDHHDAIRRDVHQTQQDQIV